jgi:hypothetical protein
MITATELRDATVFAKDNPTICAEIEQHIIKHALDGNVSCVINTVAKHLAAPMQRYLEVHGYAVKFTEADENYCVDLVVNWE